MNSRTSGGEPVYATPTAWNEIKKLPGHSAAALSRRIVAFPKVAVELVERNAAVSLRHVGERFLNCGDVLVKRLRLRMQPSPFIERFFWGQVDSVGTELVG